MELQMTKKTEYAGTNLKKLEMIFAHYSFTFEVEWVSEGAFNHGVVSVTHIHPSRLYPEINVSDEGKVTLDFEGFDNDRLRIVDRILEKLNEAHIVMKQVNSELRQLERDGFKFIGNIEKDEA